MIPNLQLQYFLSLQANEGSLRLSWLERAMAEQSSSQLYQDFATQSVLLERENRSHFFMARQPPVGMGLMPSVPQQPITATLPQHDTSQSHEVEPSGPAHGRFKSRQATVNAGQSSTTNPFQ